MIGSNNRGYPKRIIELLCANCHVRETIETAGFEKVEFTREKAGLLTAAQAMRVVAKTMDAAFSG